MCAVIAIGMLFSLGVVSPVRSKYSCGCAGVVALVFGETRPSYRSDYPSSLLPACSSIVLIIVEDTHRNPVRIGTIVRRRCPGWCTTDNRAVHLVNEGNAHQCTTAPLLTHLQDADPRGGPHRVIDTCYIGREGTGTTEGDERVRTVGSQIQQIRGWIGTVSIHQAKGVD